ncbi:DUF1992 domain-containing protein [Streptomyces sp. NPDC021093]|uniref:DUF1992 domain-containing protein n=1 Tax=Streptomyces sp. NPDC021093 TaxID=3365112 RepID=UPI00379BCC64
MTERKPPGVDFETWVDKQIREATERGAFDNLAGAGKPLPSDAAPYDELWWIKDKMQREKASYLPPGLALRKEAEEVRVRAVRAPSERIARELLAEINEKIAEALRRPPPGPPLQLQPFDVDVVLAERRELKSDR